MMKIQREEAEVGPVLRLLSETTGLTFPASRIPDVEQAMQRAMAATNIISTRDLVAYLASDRTAFDSLVADVTIGETYFFREPAHFDAIRQTVLPALLRTRPADAPIRVWSAGCATGEEPYSIAILMDQERVGQRVDILATDISQDALKKARKAEYGMWSFRNGQCRPEAPYFSRVGRRAQLAESLRSRVTFRPLNLASYDYPSLATGTSDVDLILCRNVLIYLDSKTVEHVAQRMLQSLRPEGWLITGPSDPPLWDHADFETVITSAGVFYRRGSRARTGPAARYMAAPVSQSSFGAAGADSRSKAVARTAVARTPEPKPERAGPAIERRPKEPVTSQSDVNAFASDIRGLANAGSLQRAERAAVEAVLRHPLVPELHFLHGLVLMALERGHDAEAALRRVIYLDRSLAAAHLALGSILKRRGELAAARRAFAAAHVLCANRPAPEPVALTDGDTAGRLAQTAEVQVRDLNETIQAEC